MPVDHPLAAAMHQLTALLESDLLVSASIGHNATMGSAREQIIRERLAPYIPSGFSAVSGVAINAQGERSQQLDLMIVDDTAGRPFINSGGQCVVPVELVHACFQIKTSVAPSSLASAVENIASFLSLWPDEEAAQAAGAEKDSRPFTAIIAFKASGADQDLFEAFVRSNLALERHHQVECLLVPGRLFIYMAADVSGPDGNPYGTYTPVQRAEASYWAMAQDGRQAEDATLLFYLLFTAFLAHYTAPRYSPWVYAEQAGLLNDRGLVFYWTRDGTPEDVDRNRARRKAGLPYQPDGPLNPPT